MKRMKEPVVIIITRRRADDVPVEPPVPPPPESGVRPRWTRLRGDIQSEFRTHGARVWTEDKMKSARTERRIDETKR